MELTFTSGARAGEHLQLTESPITIGRELDNVVLLPVEGVSRHHAEIRRTGDSEEWEIFDLGSTNGVRINGVRIQGQAPLADGDVFEICGQAIAVNLRPPVGTVIFKPLNAAAAELTPEAAARRAVPADYAPPPPPPPPPPPAGLGKGSRPEMLAQAVHSGEVNLFDGPPKRPTPPGAQPTGRTKSRKYLGLSNRTFYIAVGGVAVIVAMLAVILLRPAPKPSAPTVEKPRKFVLLYERERLDDDNIFRYTLRFENDQAVFTLDDLRSNRHFTYTVPKLESDFLRRMEDDIKHSGFYSLSDQSARGATGGTRRETRRLMVADDEKVHDVTIINDAPPDAFETVENMLQDFANDQNLITVSLTPEELMRAAQELFDRAENLYSNRNGNPQYCLPALGQYQLAMEYMEQFSPKPAIYETARRHRQEMEDERTAAITRLQLEIQRQVAIKDYEQLYTSLREMQCYYPEDSPEYQKIKNRLLQVESQLPRGRRR